MSFAQAQIARGLRKQKRGDLAGALHHYSAVIKREPKNAHALYFASLGAYQLKRMDEAVRLMTRVVQLAPKHADAWYNLGKFYQDKREPHTALNHYIAALEQDADHIEALINAGNLYAELDEPRVAEQCYHRALAQDTSRPEAQYNRAFVKLARGDYATGWQDYEARWGCTGIILEYGRDFMRTVPMWDGSAMTGKTLLLHAEQGLGDTIQFIRYLPLVIEQSRANVIVEVQAPLVNLIRDSFPDVTIIERHTDLPHFDVHCPLMSLPAKCGTTSLDTIPWSGPYLTRPRCGFEVDSSRAVGVCWAGSKGHLNDHNRSVTPKILGPVLSIMDVDFVSLQIGDRADEADRLQLSCSPLKRIDDRVKDFADSAAIIKSLSLVITVDTSTAHLAGALGVPTWLMLPTLPDFRWMSEGTTTPWYPSMTLYRQTKRGQWTDVVQRMAADLRARIA